MATGSLTQNYDGRDAVLRALGVELDEVACAEPMGDGLSGARLTRLRLERRTPGGARTIATRVLKEVVAGASWLEEPGNTTRVPGVQLWAAGLLETLPSSIASGVGAYALAEGTPGRGALLMRDLRGRLWKRPERTPPGGLTPDVLTLLDSLAKLHARFWEDERLCDARVGLLPAKAALLLTSPARVAERIAAGDPEPYLRLASSGWETFFRLAAPEDAATLRAVLAGPEPWLRAISALPKTLVHGDVWGPNLGWLPRTHVAPVRGRRALLLDWALAMMGPATYDPLWLCGTWHELEPARVLAAYRARLERHLAARGRRLSGETWRALADAGYLRTALTCGEAFGWSAERARGAARRRAEARARWWAQRGARAARRMVGENEPGAEPR